MLYPLTVTVRRKKLTCLQLLSHYLAGENSEKMRRK